MLSVTDGKAGHTVPGCGHASAGVISQILINPGRVIVIKLMNVQVACNVKHMLSIADGEAGDTAPSPVCGHASAGVISQILINPGRLIVIKLMNVLVACNIKHVLSVADGKAGDTATGHGQGAICTRKVLIDPGRVVVVKRMNVLVACNVKYVLSIAGGEAGDFAPGRGQGAICTRKVLVGP